MCPDSLVVMSESILSLGRNKSTPASQSSEVIQMHAVEIDLLDVQF